MLSIPKIPDIPEEERTPLVVKLLEIIQIQSEIIEALRDEVLRLKGGKPRPRIKPSNLEKERQRDKEEGSCLEDGKRPGSIKRSKTAGLEIHKERVIPPEHIQEGSKFKGYQD